jgi:hypothetical protein
LSSYYSRRSLPTQALPEQDLPTPLLRTKFRTYAPYSGPKLPVFAKLLWEARPSRQIYAGLQGVKQKVGFRPRVRSAELGSLTTVANVRSVGAKQGNTSSRILSSGENPAVSFLTREPEAG